MRNNGVTMKNTQCNKLGAELKRIRTEKNVDQEYLATSIGKTREAVSQYESGKRDLPTESIKSIAKCLEVDPVDLLETRLLETISMQIAKFKASR